MSTPEEATTTLVTRPARPGDWEVSARSEKIAAAWKELCNQFSGECQRVYDQLSTDPLNDDGDRQQPLRGETGIGTFEGRTLQRWQIDVGSGSRVWYFVIREDAGKGQKRRSGKVIIDQVHPGHPKATERNNSGKRRPGRN